jgi:hypothetical protein
MALIAWKRRRYKGVDKVFHLLSRVLALAY